MARWLNLQIAQATRRRRQYSYYPQPGEWIWHLAAGLLDDVLAPLGSLFARCLCSGRCFNFRPPSTRRTGRFRVANDYLEDDDSGIQRWQLAQRIADSFDRYQAFRPQLIRRWSDAATKTTGRLRLSCALIERRGCRTA